MLANSQVNSITFKNLSGDYPSKDNTLHNSRKIGNFKIIPYCQKFHSKGELMHIAYIQFSSDVSTDVTVKAYDSRTRALLQTISENNRIYIPGTYAIYYMQFAITLGSTYANKEVYFTATQGSDVLTSEPIYVSDYTDLIEKGILRYVKYTNFDRADSDLDSGFVNWSIIPSTGHYMDFFIEGIDLTPNDTDNVEVLHGSQNETILSASYFSGKVLETGGIPDYMAEKMGISSSLDVFTVNEIQYIKNGEINQNRYGNSTSYQISMKLTQKNAIGINIDNIDLAGETIVPEPPPVEDPAIVYPMYIGSVTDFNPSESIVKLMGVRTGYKSNQSTYYTATSKRYCFAYPTVYGSLAKIMSANESDITTGFQITIANFTFGDATVNYTIYTLVRPTSQIFRLVSYLFYL